MVTEYIELTTQLRHCARCGMPTLWATTTQLSSGKGLCLDHAGVRPCRGAPADHRAALAVVMDVFGPVTRGTVEAPQRPAEARRVVGRWLVTGRAWRVTERPTGGTDERNHTDG